MNFNSLNDIVKQKDNIIYIVGDKIVFKNNPDVEEDFKVLYNGKYIDFVNIELNVSLYELFSDFIAIRSKRYVKLNEKQKYVDGKGGTASYLIINKKYFDDGTFGEVYPLNSLIPEYSLLAGIFKAFQFNKNFSEIKALIKEKLSDKPNLISKLSSLYTVKNGFTFDGYNLLVSSTTSLSSIIEHSDIKSFVLYKNNEKNVPIVIAHDEESKYKVIYVRDLEQYSDLDILKERYKNNIYNKAYSVFESDLSGEKLIKFLITENSDLFVSRVYLAQLIKVTPEKVFRNGRAYIGDYSFGETYFRNQVSQLYDFQPDNLTDLTEVIYNLAQSKKSTSTANNTANKTVTQTETKNKQVCKTLENITNENRALIPLVLIHYNNLIYVAKNNYNSKNSKYWKLYKINITNAEIEALKEELPEYYKVVDDGKFLFAFGVGCNLNGDEILKYITEKSADEIIVKGYSFNKKSCPRVFDALDKVRNALDNYQDVTSINFGDNKEAENTAEVSEPVVNAENTTVEQTSETTTEETTEVNAETTDVDQVESEVAVENTENIAVEQEPSEETSVYLENREETECDEQSNNAHECRTEIIGNNIINIIDESVSVYIRISAIMEIACVNSIANTYTIRTSYNEKYSCTLSEQQFKTLLMLLK